MAAPPVVPGALMGTDGIDPRFHLTNRQEEQILSHGDHFDRDSNALPIEVYLYWAKRERERELRDPRPVPDAPWIIVWKKITGRGHTVIRPETGAPAPTATIVHDSGSVGSGSLEKVGHADGHEKSHEKGEKSNTLEAEVGPPRSDIEGDGPHDWARNTAYHLLRTSSWQAVFYMITSDILGFTSAPYSFYTLGIAPGCLVFTFLFLLAFGGGQILWHMYMRLDSEQYPVTCYSDLAERTYGRWVRHLFTALQTIQLLFNVGILITGQSTQLATIIEYKFCFIAIAVFWTLAGMILGQIRSLRNFAWFTNLSIWLNLLTMILVMVGIGLYDPVPSQSQHKDLSEPKAVSAWVPSYTAGWYMQQVGVQNIVYSYGGAMIFIEFLAEMRRPRDFWKAAFLAQLFCYLMYMFFGLYCYAMQGAYTSQYPSLDFDNRALQLVSNIIGLVTGGVAMCLYAHVGQKTIYQNVFRAYFRAPSLVSRGGKIIWPFLVIGYWIISWVIGVAIPSIATLGTLVGAAAILQFTYTFPPMLLLGHWLQSDAVKGDQPWEPGMAIGAGRVDTWKQASRWKRGIRRFWYVKLTLFILFLAALANAALGIYSGAMQAKEGFSGKIITSFSCKTPNQGS